jgi:hypothetical protein
VVGAVAEPVVGGECCHVGVADCDCFGLAGGAGGVDDVGQVLGIEGDAGRGSRSVSQQLGRVDHDGAAQPGGGGVPGLVAQHDPRPGLGQE